MVGNEAKKKQTTFVFGARFGGHIFKFHMQLGHMQFIRGFCNNNLLDTICYTQKCCTVGAMCCTFDFLHFIIQHYEGEMCYFCFEY